MLTDSEKRWLRGRELSPLPYCAWCWNANFCALMKKHCWCPTDCLDTQDPQILKDAAEFSERVAARLAADENCGVDEDCPPDMPFGWGRLKAARLAVEEEMDGTD